MQVLSRRTKMAFHVEHREKAAQWAIAGMWLDPGPANREDGSDDRQLARRLPRRPGDQRAG
jgi:hypothetical protein